MATNTTRKLTIWINGDEVKNTFKGISNAMFHSRNELAKMTIGSKEYIEQTKKIQQLKGLMDEHRKMQGQIATGWAKIKSGVLQSFAGNALANIASSAFQKIGQLFGDAWTKMKEFGTGISELKAITGASGNDLDYLKQKALELAAVYGKSARDIVEAMKLVGSAKPELLENVEALGMVTEAVITLSKASGMDMQTTTQSLTTIMNQFGHSANEVTKDINILAAGSKYGAVEVNYLSESIVKVGTVMKTAGLSLEQGVAAMELFGEKGIRAETAGNGFKKVLLELQSDSKNYTNGIFDLNKAIENNKSISTDNIALQKKFGQEFFTVAQILLQNSDRFKDLTKQITNTNVAFEQAAEQSNNIKGDLDKLSGSWDKLVLSIDSGDGVISKSIRFVIKGLTDFVNEMSLATSNQTSFADKTKTWASYLGQIFIGLESSVDNFWKSYQKLFGETDLNTTKKQREDEIKARLGDDKEFLDKLKAARERGQKAAQEEAEAKRNLEAATNNELTEDEKKALELRKKEWQRANQEKLKATEDLHDQLKLWSIEMINDEQLQKDAEITLWYEKEAEKINLSKAAAEERNKALEVLDAVYFNRLSQLYQANADEYIKTSLEANDEIINAISNQMAIDAEFANSLQNNPDIVPPNIVAPTDDQITELWDKRSEAVKKYGDVAQTVIGSIFDLQSSIAERELQEFEQENDNKKQILDSRLKKGVISQDTYNKQVAALDVKLEKERRKLAVAEAKRNKAMRLFEAIINTAASVTKVAWNPPLAIAVGALGGIQIAAIAAQPIPKAAKGMRVNSPTFLQAGEAGPEIVLSNKIVGSKSLGPIADDLARIQEGRQPRFLGQPSVPNFGGMSKAISGVSGQSIQNNTVITNNNVDNKSINSMNEKIDRMSDNLEKFTGTVEKIKYLKAVITSDDLKEYENDEAFRLRYSRL